MAQQAVGEAERARGTRFAGGAGASAAAGEVTADALETADEPEVDETSDVVDETAAETAEATDTGAEAADEPAEGNDSDTDADGAK